MLFYSILYFSIYFITFPAISSPKIQQKNCDATIQRYNTTEGFGFVVRGGYHEQHIKQRPLVVTHVRTNSPADKLVK